MRFDSLITLIKHEDPEEPDKFGNLIPVEIKTDVFAHKQSITRNEFYLAVEQDLKVEYVFIINAIEYNGENELEFNGDRYGILRVYEVDGYNVELTVARQVGV